ncbi:hypothetical protein EW146_g9881 [Bondarzewia mesenterica]|uniref:Rab-GAP TBC domain-containing protein n=1 Tax=Bondarzewia mesenterica TaxID=1095465 RepID=A0A4V3XCD9_9AGAM|nr:hypothetical protein EW146_g9881 [Bondarzewia mesenterica]
MSSTEGKASTEAATGQEAAQASRPLDELFSPTGTPQPAAQAFPRDSVADSDFGEVALDDSHFSTVTLSARDSLTAIKSPIEESPPRFGEDGRRVTIAMGETPISSPRRAERHKKSASSASTRSANRDSFLFQMQESPKGPNEGTGSQRGSVEGHLQLQEEFNRLQISDQSDDGEAGGIDWEFWGSVMSDYQTFALENGEKLAHAIEKGIPDSLRGMMWQLMSASKDIEMESVYLKLLKEISTHEKAITRDLGRTFPHHAFFTDGQGIGQENLFNVLKAYSLYDPEVGYCQGLPFIVAILLLNMPDEEAFCLLVRLMQSYDLRGHFLPEMPKLQLHLFQFDRLIEEILPVLHIHFLRQGVKSSMFCSQWFLTLFSYRVRFPLEMVHRIFDNCLASGIESIFGFSLALLQKNEEKLLNLKFDEIVAFLNTQIVDTYLELSHDNTEGGHSKPKYRVDEFVQDAISMKITPFMLDSYTHEYNEMIRVREAHAMEIDALRSSNRNLSSQVNALQASLTQLSKEHVEVLNQLVAARLRHEELESELVRYKLLYAESVHHNEDALSGHRISLSAAILMVISLGVLTTALYATLDLSISRWPAQHVHRPAHNTRKALTERPWLAYTAAIVFASGSSWALYENYQPFRHTVLAGVRCSRVAEAAVLGAIDYKRTFAKEYASEEEQLHEYSQCHLRSARRVLKALLANGGVFIKLGQHMASLIVLPPEWTGTMRPLQDQCVPTPYEAVEELFVSEMGQHISELFDDFTSEPIGVASLAQVHVGHHRQSGKSVAVKLQHPHLAEFCEIDMEMVEVTLGWIKRWFPDFEFTWLGEEMRENLPKEMDFVHEAHNAQRVAHDFRNMRTSLYIPEVIAATKRVLIMEFIEGARVDDLQYLAEQNIDRNKVSLELARIFSQMLYLNGWFHADPHPGNLLIRPRPSISKSPYNFEIVLLDHGLYFDLDTRLRINYSKLWLSLLAPLSPETNADRRKYAELVGNIGPDLYPVFEAALTGRATMSDSPDTQLVDTDQSTFQRASSMLEMMPQTEEEMEAIRNAVITSGGLLLSVFNVLRRVPRRVLMVFKVNDLTRSLDHALATTHSKIRVFLITAKYCATAVWQDDRRRVIDEMRENGLFSPGTLVEYFVCWWKFEKLYRSLIILETFMDIQAHVRQTGAWIRGLWNKGFEGAHKAAAGLA